MFQHDYPLVHKARPIKTWLAKVGVEELKWLTQSPQINPTEHFNCIQLGYGYTVEVQKKA